MVCEGVLELGFHRQVNYEEIERNLSVHKNLPGSNYF